MITIATLIAAGAAPTQARMFEKPLGVALDRFGITTKVRVASFLAQALHESARLTSMEESLYYRDPARIRMMWPTRVYSMADAAKLCRNPQALANTVYANRYGNGDKESGDGWRYRGRGLFGLTFLNNYLAAGVALGRPYGAHPELVAQIDDACLTAAWYFVTRGCLPAADNGDTRGVTSKINPAMAGLDDRLALFDRAIEALPAA